MSIVPLPTPLQHLGGRCFSFYPPIRNAGPNEWLFRRATSSECIVANARSGEEIFVPRIFIGEVSYADEPPMLVTLSRELEARGGVIVPRERRVVEFPREMALAANDLNRPARPRQPAQVVNIRLEPRPEPRAWKWMGVAAVLSAVALTIVGDVARQSQARPRGDSYRGYRAFLQLGPADDYAATVRKIGVPARVRSAEVDGRAVRSLDYPSRRYSVVLMGATYDTARYVATLNPDGRVLDLVRSGDPSAPESLLRSLPGWRAGARSAY